MESFIELLGALNKLDNSGFSVEQEININIKKQSFIFLNLIYEDEKATEVAFSYLIVNNNKSFLCNCNLRHQGCISRQLIHDSHNREQDVLHYLRDN